MKLIAFKDIESFNAYQLRNIHQRYDSSLDLIKLQKSLSEYDCLFGVPINIYDTKITSPQGCHILLLQDPNNSSNQIKVIFKPRGKLIQALSVGAFNTAQYLGMDTTIPPLSPYLYEGQEGIISYFIDTNADNSFWHTSGDYKLIKDYVCPKCLNNYYIFSYLFGNWDLKWRNTLLFDNQGIKDIACIDIDAIVYPGLGDYGTHFFIPWVKLSKTSVPYSLFSEKDTFYIKIEDINSYLDLLFPFFEFTKEVQNELITSQKYAIVSKLAKSYVFWERPSVKHFIDENAWWIRLYEHLDGVAPAFAEFADKKIIEQLDTLDLNILKTLFNDLDLKNTIINEEFYAGILRRRDAMRKVLKAY